LDYQDKNIKIATNVPGLKNKIQAHLSDLSDDTNIFWYIKFNIPVDETSVSEKTMSVTDTDGYLMRTEITYDDKKHVILISPLDTYEQEVFYILRISKKVRSKRGNKLKSEIYILFKLMNNQISEFKTLKSNVHIPSVQKRPKNYDEMFREKIKTASRLYSFDETPFKEAGPGMLPTAPVRINIFIGVFGLIIIIAFIFTQIMPMLYAGLAICAIGIIHIVAQISKRETRAVFAYNAGVRHFNKERYDAARYNFKKAALFDAHNEMVEYANNKKTIYL
jgi:hypothetical protein